MNSKFWTQSKIHSLAVAAADFVPEKAASFRQKSFFVFFCFFFETASFFSFVKKKIKMKKFSSIFEFRDDREGEEGNQEDQVNPKVSISIDQV